MSTVFKLAWLLLIAIAAVGLIAAGRAYSDAKGAAQHERSSATLLTAQVEQIEALKSLSEAWADRRRPESGLAARLGEALASAGLPASTLANVTPQPETPVGSATPSAVAARRQRASLTLAPITLPQVGAFLEAWRAREPYWTVASIDLSRDTAQKAPEGGGDLPLRAVITLDAVYLDQKGDVR